MCIITIVYIYYICKGFAMDRNLKTKIAFFYHTCGMTQEEIAARLSLTRQKVNAVIGMLKEEGIVSITICGNDDGCVELECALEQKFGLPRALVAPSYDDPAVTLLKVANTAAQYLEQVIGSGDRVGVSWGRTLRTVVREMRFRKKKNCLVVQLMGAQSMEGHGTKSDDIVRSLAEKLDCPSYLLYAPVLVSRRETRALLAEEKPIRHAFAMMRECNIGVFGIGAVCEDAPMHRLGYLSDGDIAQLRRDGFVADIGLNPVRADGSMDGCFLSERLINADAETIRGMENAIGIASGIEKAEAVAAVLRSGLLNTLIIDRALAEAVLANQ